MPAVRNRVTTRDGLNVALVEERLRDAILRGEIAAGSVTTQVALGERLGVGRTPIREALRLLQREGFVVAEPNRRVRIAALSGDDAEELYVMRLSLETVAIRLTTPALASRDVAALEGHLAQMEHFAGEQDAIGLREPHRAFHMALVAGAGERGLREIGRLFDHGERYRTAYGAPGEAEWQLRSAEHRAILDAVRARDVEQAVTSLAEHYVHTAQLIFAGLDPGHDLRRLRATLVATAPAASILAVSPGSSASS